MVCIQGHEQLAVEGIKNRVVSMPSWGLFERQPEDYPHSVIPPDVTVRVSVGQSSVFGWERYVGTQGQVIGRNSFGASAPPKVVGEIFLFTVDHMVAATKAQIERRQPELTVSKP